MSEKRKILIYGGSFSPPTLAHEAIIAACLSLKQFDEVWGMPSGDRIDKEIYFDDAARMRMLEVLKVDRFAANPRLKITDFEIKLPRPTQTFKTVRALRQAFPQNDFYFVFGNDSYLDMPNWERGNELKATLKVVIFGSDVESRKGGKDENLTAINLPTAYDHISSSKVRLAMKNRQKLDGLVSEPIARLLKSL